MHTPAMDKKSTQRLNAGDTGIRLKQRLAQLLVRSSCTTKTTTAFVGLSKPNSAGPRHQEEPPHSPYFCTPCVYERPKFEDGSRPRRGASVARHCHGAGATAASGRHSSDALLSSSLLAAKDGNKKQSRRRSRGKPRSPSASWRHGGSCSFGDSARRPRMTSASLYSSSSSTETDDETAPAYSSAADESGDGEDAETRTLFSFLSFSSDSTTSEFYHTNSSRKNARRRAPPRTSDPMAFRPLLSAARTKHHHECNDRKKEKLGTVRSRSGMAVVKRSSNPYADFVSSMVEMVVGRRIASVGKMEELLRSYLSLNSQEHHPAILAAFEDVWETVFGEVCS